MGAGCARTEELEKGVIRGHSTAAAATPPLLGRYQTAAPDRDGPLPIRHQTATPSGVASTMHRGSRGPGSSAIMLGNGPWLTAAAQLEMREGAAQPPEFRY
jgi:hypothetical protein